MRSVVNNIDGVVVDINKGYKENNEYTESIYNVIKKCCEDNCSGDEILTHVKALLNEYKEANMDIRMLKKIVNMTNKVEDREEDKEAIEDIDKNKVICEDCGKVAINNSVGVVEDKDLFWVFDKNGTTVYKCYDCTGKMHKEAKRLGK